jgi:ATP/maltotriose-dependent transcriptional regulator MalT
LCCCRLRLRPEGIEQRLAKLHEGLHRRFTRYLRRTRIKRWSRIVFHEQLRHFGSILTTEQSHQRQTEIQPRSHARPSHAIPIDQLVAQGLTNAAIGAQLWISQNAVKQALKRMFRKLDVSARTELVAVLRDIL